MAFENYTSPDPLRWKEKVGESSEVSEKASNEYWNEMPKALALRLLGKYAVFLKGKPASAYTDALERARTQLGFVSRDNILKANKFSIPRVESGDTMMRFMKDFFTGLDSKRPLDEAKLACHYFNQYFKVDQLHVGDRIEIKKGYIFIWDKNDKLISNFPFVKVYKEAPITQIVRQSSKQQKTAKTPQNSSTTQTSGLFSSSSNLTIPNPSRIQSEPIKAGDDLLSSSNTKVNTPSTQTPAINTQISTKKSQKKTTKKTPAKKKKPTSKVTRKPGFTITTTSGGALPKVDSLTLTPTSPNRIDNDLLDSVDSKKIEKAKKERDKFLDRLKSPKVKRVLKALEKSTYKMKFRFDKTTTLNGFPKLTIYNHLSYYGRRGGKAAEMIFKGNGKVQTELFSTTSKRSLKKENYSLNSDLKDPVKFIAAVFKEAKRKSSDKTVKKVISNIIAIIEANS